MGLLSAFRRTFAGGETRARASSLGIRDDAGTVRRWPRFEDLLEDPARVDTSEPPALAADDPFADDLRTWWRDGFVVKKSFAPALPAELRPGRVSLVLLCGSLAAYATLALAYLWTRFAG